MTSPTIEEVSANLQKVLIGRTAVIRQRNSALDLIVDLQVELEGAYQHIQRLTAEIEALKTPAVVSSVDVETP